MGLHMAWPHARIVGVDVKPMPRYPFEHIVADAMTFPLEGYDFIWASPPCQDHMQTPLPTAKKHGTGWMLDATRERLLDQSAPWVLENVSGAPMRADYRLCGCMFGLRTDEWELRRVRLFEVSWRIQFEWLKPHEHLRPAVAVVGNGMPSWHRRRWKLTPECKSDYRAFHELCRELMGIDWMTRDQLSQAIPPAYSRYIAQQLTSALEAAA
jgi:DNA (cytosine-5)-methyltransferase 1